MPGFEVLEHCRDDDSYMYSSSSYTYFVVSLDTGDELMTFHGSDDQDSAGRKRDGVESVRIEDGAAVARHYDGKVERHPLPAKIDWAEGGAQIVLHWPDGTIERRDRKEALGILKFGHVVSMRKLIYP